MSIGDRGRIGRRDLSPYLVHLTRDSEDETARKNLLSMLADWTIEARTVYGAARRMVDHGANPHRLRSVCMSETPIDHIPQLAAKMPGRRIELSEYGVLLNKPAIVAQGGHPVWYTNAGHGVGGGQWPIKVVDELIDLADRGRSYRIGRDDEIEKVDLEQSLIGTLAPFIETVSAASKDFAWEREWRVVGDVNLGLAEVAAIIVPDEEVEDSAPRLARAYKREGVSPHPRPIVGARWGQAKIEKAMQKRRKRSG